MPERKRSIASFCRLPPRPGQEYTFGAIEAGWDSHDVFVIGAPVGAGKQMVAESICAWAAAKSGGGGLASAYAVPNNALLGQLLRDVPSFPKLLGADRYSCTRNPGRSCDSWAKEAGRHCRVAHLSGPAAIHHPESCHKVRDLRKARSEKKLACVYHTLLGHKLAQEKDVLIYDEAHNLVRLRQEFSGFSLDMRAARVPDTVWTEAELLAWCESRDARSSPEVEVVDRLRAACAGSSPTHLARIEEGEDGRGRPRRACRAVPVDVSGAPPTLWPRRGQKIVLMSATIGDSDLRQLGLTGRRVLRVDVPSDIPVDRRPIYFDPAVRMTHGREATEIPVLADWLEYQLHHSWPGVRGIIHLPYRLGALLHEECRRRASSSAAGPGILTRVAWFSPADRASVLADFLTGTWRDEVLIAAGCSEGLDLKDDLARFQVVADAPLASMMDPGVRWLHEHDPQRARWEGVKTLAQTYGRVSRHPADFGETVVVDEAALPIMVDGQMPTSAREAYKDVPDYPR